MLERIILGELVQLGQVLTVRTPVVKVPFIGDWFPFYVRGKWRERILAQGQTRTLSWHVVDWIL